MIDIDKLYKEHQNGQDRTVEIWEHPDVQKKVKMLQIYYFSNYRMSKNEALSVIYDGYTRTFNTYDIDKAASFTTILVNWVKHAMQEHLNGMVLNGVFENKNAAKYFKKLHSHLSVYPDATDDELLKVTGIRTNRMLNNLRNISPEVFNTSELGDTNDSIIVEMDLGEFENYGDLYDALQELPEDYMYALIQRYGFWGTEKLTLSEIGELSGCSAENIRQILNRAKKKLRKLLIKRNIML